MSKLEAVFARGDESLGKVLLAAYKNGCVFDSWGEFFDAEKWQNAFDECGVDCNRFIREYAEDEEFPWGFIDVGVDNDYLLSERRLSRSDPSSGSITTPDCRGNCRGCGLQKSRKEAFKNSCAKHIRRDLPDKC